MFGDGSVVLVPTPDHTLGHQSARVQTSTGEVVLAGDACHLQRALDELLVPDHGDDLVRYRATLEWFRARQQAGATIAFGHHALFWATVPQPVPWNPAR
jgi:N-acyl homoserine lactone hydrolase